MEIFAMKLLINFYVFALNCYVQILELMIHINQAKPDQTKPKVVRLWFDSGSLLQFGKLWSRL